MAKLITVGELKDILNQFEDDQEIMAVHQPSWPLREVIKGVWDPYMNGDEECDDGCQHVAGNHNEKDGCMDCDCGWYPNPDEKKVLLLVVDGCPMEINPYGPKEAFDDYVR